MKRLESRTGLFNLTNLKDLDFICEMALEHAARVQGPHWIERIDRYRNIIKKEIERLSAEEKNGSK